MPPARDRSTRGDGNARRLAVSAAVATAAVLGYVALRPDRGQPSAPPAASATDAAPPAVTSAEPPRKVVGAAHVLVSYRGALRAPAGIDRSKEDARRRAEEALAVFRSGKATFDELVARYSDDAPTLPSHGDVGNFERGAMPDAFADAAFGMPVGETSGVVETPLGFHIIQRRR